VPGAPEGGDGGLPEPVGRRDEAVPPVAGREGGVEVPSLWCFVLLCGCVCLVLLH
jgi:hypothetical protein